MADSPYIFDANAQNFQQVMESSYQVPILVDFWADWCQPCKTLMPILAKLANEYQGAFILIKVNSDEQQQLAAQFGVRNLPTVKVIKDGRIVDEFMGVQPKVRNPQDSLTATVPARPSLTASRRWKCTTTAIWRVLPN